jgi:hypothetical protein
MGVVRREPNALERLVSPTKMFMHVPCWNLPRVHRLLAAKGVTDRMLTAPGYGAVLKMAAGKADPSLLPVA